MGDSLCGSWKGNRSPEEIIKDIKKPLEPGVYTEEVKSVIEIIKGNLRESLNKNFVDSKMTPNLLESIKSLAVKFCSEYIKPSKCTRIKFDVVHSGFGTVSIKPINLFTLCAMNGINTWEHDIPERNGEIETKIGTFKFEDGEGYFKPKLSAEYITVSFKLEKEEK